LISDLRIPSAVPSPLLSLFVVLIQIALGTSPPTATGRKCRRRRAGAGSLSSMRQSRWPRRDYRQAAFKLTGRPTQQPYVSARRSPLAAQRSARQAAQRTACRTQRHLSEPPKINLPRRTKSNPVTIAPPEQLRSEVFDSLRRRGSRSGLCSKTVDHGA
jgi:hypothetical protein